MKHGTVSGYRLQGGREWKLNEDAFMILKINDWNPNLLCIENFNYLYLDLQTVKKWSISIFIF